MAQQWHIKPLDVLLGVINRDPIFSTYSPHEIACAVAAAPYVHARLQAVMLQQTPNQDAEAKRNMLKGLSYEDRKRILEILGTAQVVKEIEAEAEEAAPQITGDSANDSQ